MFKLGLTGSMATGKTTVLAMFADAGFPTISADEIVHELYQHEAVAPLRQVFPLAIINHKVDRSKLARILINAPHRAIELEQIVHPLVRQRIMAFLVDHSKGTQPLVIVDIPLLLETQKVANETDTPSDAYAFDAVAVTACDKQIQRARALARPGMDVEKLETLLARQMPQAEKRARADYVIDTNGALADTRDQVNKIIQACLSANQNSEAGQ